MGGFRGVAVGVLGLLALIALFWRGAVAPSALPRETGRDRVPAVRPTTSLGRASAAQMPKPLHDVFLGMDQAQLSAVRPAARRQEAADRDAFYVFDEGLGAEGRALYLFSKENATLAQVQLAQRLADEVAVGARFERLQAEYGPVSGVWDCAAPGQLPTRRFSWLRSGVAVMDVVLLLGEQSLATFYVASPGQMQESLASAGCVATPPERFTTYPAVPLDQ
jgi:hypothetical protein